MSSTTTRLGLTKPQTSDARTVLRTSIGANADSLDGALISASDTISNRSSVVPSPVVGSVYYATDTGYWYIYNGTAWLVLTVPDTGWVNITRGTGVGPPSGHVAQMRLKGDQLLCRGALLVPSGTTAIGAVPLAVTLGSIVRTIGGRYIGDVPTGTTVDINPDGTITSNVAPSPGQGQLLLHDLTINL